MTPQEQAADLAAFRRLNANAGMPDKKEPKDTTPLPPVPQPARVPLYKKGREGPPYLTPMETQVMRLVSDGRSSREIADMLFVSKRTVDFHLQNVYEKLNVKNRIQALNRAVDLGLLE